MYARHIRRWIGLGAILTLLALITLHHGRFVTPRGDRAGAARFDPGRFMLNAFLLPAINADEPLLSWVDPRPILNCGPATTVQVNGAPLKAGALVPFVSFDYEWHAHGCRPHGLDGPRYDGRFTLTVYREEWGISATLIPAGLHYTSASGQITVIEPSGLEMPLQTEVHDAPERLE